MSLSKIALRTLLVILLTLIIGGCGGAEGRKAKYLERAMNFMKEEKFDKAAVELKNVLQIDPKNAQAYFVLGQVEEARQDLRQSYGYYTRALELKPDYVDAQLRLARFYLFSGETTKASELAEAVLAGNASNPEARLVKAAVMALQGNARAATKEAEEVLTANPGNVDAVQLLSGMYLKQSNPDRAIDLIQKGIAANEKSVTLRMILADVFASRNEIDEVERLYREIIAIEPAKMQHRVLLAKSLARSKQLDKAETVLRDAIQSEPKDIRRYELLAEFIAAEVDVARAEKELQAAIDQHPDAYGLRFMLGSLYERLDNRARAVAVYRDIVGLAGRKPDGLRARNKLAVLLLADGGITEADKLVAEVLKESPHDNDGLILQGKLAIQKGDAVGAIGAFRAVLKDIPDSPEVLGLLANAHLLNGSAELAKENFKQAIEANPRSPQAHLQLAQYYTHLKQYGAAVAELDKTLALAPADLTALLAKAEIQQARADFSGAENTLNKLKQLNPRGTLGYYRLGQLYATQKKYDLALREFEQALKLSASPFEPLAAIVNNYLQRGQTDQAVARLKALLKDKPQEPVALELLGEVYLSQKNFTDAEVALQAARDNAPQWNLPYLNLAKLHSAQKDMAGAIKYHEAGLKAIPGDRSLLLALAALQQAAQKYEEAIATYEQVLKINPDHLVAANNLALLLADRAGDQASLRRARGLLTRFEKSNNPVFLDSVGWVYYRSGDNSKAIEVLSRVNQLAPRVPVLQYHLGMAYYKNGDMQTAKQWLAKALEKKIAFDGSEEATTTLAAIR